MRGDGDRDGRVDARELLDRDRVRNRVASGASVLLRNRKAHEAELGELADELVREATDQVELCSDRRDALPRERPDRVADQLLLGSEVEVHAARMPSRAIGSGRSRRGGEAETMGTVQEFFEGLPSRVTPDRIEGMNNTYVFEIEGAGVWTVAVADGAITVTEGAGDADCTFSTSEENFEKIVAGEQNPTTAYMTGKLKIKGDMGAAMKLQKIF